MTWWLPWKFIFETLLALHGTFVDQQVKRYQSWSLSISSKRQWLNNSFAQHLVCQSLRRVVWSCRCHLQCKWCTAQTEPKTAKANLSSNCTWGKTTWNILYMKYLVASKFTQADIQNLKSLNICFEMEICNFCHYHAAFQGRQMSGIFLKICFSIIGFTFQ